MCGEFGEVTVIIGLVINFLAFVPPFVSFRDTLSYISINTTLPLPLGRSRSKFKFNILVNPFIIGRPI